MNVRLGVRVFTLGLSTALLSSASAQNPKTFQQSVTGAFNPNTPPKHLAESTFVKFVQQRGISKMPYPLERLRDELAYDEFFPISMLVPKGRSAQKDNTDNNNPRRIFASYFPNKIGPRSPVGQEDYSAFGVASEKEGRLFFGHADRSRQIEVLSFNPRGRQNQPRFDYLEITNYGSPEERVREVLDRDRCTKCHQGEAGIFPPQPWTEMMSHDPLKYQARATKIPMFQSPPSYYAKDGITLTFEETPFANNAGLGFGISSFSSNLLLQAHRIVEDLCAKNLDCRKFMVLSAVLNPTFSKYIHQPIGIGAKPLEFDFSFPVTQLNKTKGTLPQGIASGGDFIKAWRSDNYAYINEFIPDISDLSSGKITVQQSDPTTPREKVRGVPPDLAAPYLFDIAFEYFGFSKKEAEEIQLIPEAIRRERVADINYSQWPLRSEDIMKALRQASPEPLAIENSPRPAERQITYESVAPLLKQYCIRCHQAGNRDGNPVIPFETENSLVNYGQKNSLARVIGRLQDRSMPPPGENAPSEDEYTLLQKYIARVGTLAPGSPAIVSTEYVNALGVRVLSRFGHGYSYLIPNGGVSINRETVSSACGTFAPDETERGRSPLQVGIGSDGRNYLALENYPGYVPGSIIQVGFLIDGSGRCSPIGVTRNGTLFGLYYGSSLSGWGHVPLRQNSSAPKALRAVSVPAINPINPKKLRYFAIASDNTVHYLTNVNFSERSYELKPLRLVGENNRIWSRVAWDIKSNQLYLEGAEGTKFAFEVDLQKLELRPAVTSEPEEYTAALFAANLLDRTSVLAIPRVYVEKRGLSGKRESN